MIIENLKTEYTIFNKQLNFLSLSSPRSCLKHPAFQPEWLVQGGRKESQIAGGGAEQLKSTWSRNNFV